MFDENKGKEYFGKEFVDRIYSIFDTQGESNFIFLHGAETQDDAQKILKEGLQCDYPEILYTSELISKNDKLLFDKMRSWPHWDRKYLVMIVLSRLTGKGGCPIWTKDDSLDIFVLSPECVLGYVDVKNRIFIDNSLYRKRGVEDYFELAEVQDRSYEVGTGKSLGITIPPDETEIYDCDLNL